MQGGGLVVRAAGPRRGRVDPVVQAIREAHVARRDRDVSQWHTEANEAAWSAERASWDAGGEDMILTSSELFSDCMFAGLDAEAPSTFTRPIPRTRASGWSLACRAARWSRSSCTTASCSTSSPVGGSVTGESPPSERDEGREAWRVDALCAETDPEAFFPEKGGSTREAGRAQ